MISAFYILDFLMAGKSFIYQMNTEIDQIVIWAPSSDKKTEIAYI